MILYCRSRNLGVVILCMVSLAAIRALTGGRVFSYVAFGEPGSMRYGYVLTLFIAALAVASLATPVAQTDQGDTGPLRRARRLHLQTLFGLALALSVVSEQFVIEGEPWAALRSCICWFGFALVSGAVFREALAWVMPFAMLFPLMWWGAATGSPAAWNWVAAPATEQLSWWVAGGTLAAGTLLWHRLRSRR